MSRNPLGTLSSAILQNSCPTGDIYSRPLHFSTLETLFLRGCNASSTFSVTDSDSLREYFQIATLALSHEPLWPHETRLCIFGPWSALLYAAAELTAQRYSRFGIESWLFNDQRRATVGSESYPPVYSGYRIFKSELINHRVNKDAPNLLDTLCNGI